MKKIIIVCFLVLIGFISASIAEIWGNPFIRGSEFLIDTNIVYIPVNGNFPSVAFDGTNYFAVWEDKRCGETSLNIFGTRVNQSGEVIDSTGIIISTASSPFHYNQKNPSVAFDGTNYLVAWSDFRNGNTYDVYGVRIDTSGMIVDTADIHIPSTSSHRFANSSIIFGRKYYFVSWINWYTSNMGSITGVRVDTGGNVVDTSVIEISLGTSSPSVSFDGKNYFIVYGFGGEIHGTRIDTSGTIIDTTKIKVATNPGVKMYPSLAFDGKRYLVVWQNFNNYTWTYDIYCARVDTSGVVVDTVALPMVTTDYDVEYPQITFSGKHYFLVWEDYRTGHADIYGARIDTSGEILDTTFIQIETNAYEQHYPSVASGGTQFLSVWNEENRSVCGSRIDTSGTLLDSSSITLSTAAYTEWYPSVSFDGRNYLVVWQDKRNGEDYDIYGARVDSTGFVLEQNCIPVSSAPVNQWYPKVTFGSSNYLVVWQDDRYSSIYGARVDTSGVVLDPGGFIITSIPGWQHEPSLTFDGRNYFVVWHDYNAPGYIYGTRIDTAGYVLDPSGINISYNQYFKRNPVTASNSSNYLVAWQEQGMHGTIVDTSGTVLDTAGFQITTYFWWGNPSITSNGIDYFVVWQDSRNPDFDIYGARVDSSGIVLDTAGIPVSIAEGDQTCPTVAFDGTDYIVLWEDYRNVFTDIYGARVSTAGIVLDTFAVVTQEGNQFSPALAKGPDEELLVTYSGFIDSINTRPANTMRIWGKLFIPPVGVKEDIPISKPLHFSLKQNFPNPIFSETQITYSIPRNLNTTTNLKIYNSTGQQVKNLVNKNQLPGFYTVRWNCIDDKGKPIPNGIYFYRLSVGENIAVKKMVVIR